MRFLLMPVSNLYPRLGRTMLFSALRIMELNRHGVNVSVKSSASHNYFWQQNHKKITKLTWGWLFLLLGLPHSHLGSLMNEFLTPSCHVVGCYPHSWMLPSPKDWAWWPFNSWSVAWSPCLFGLKTRRGGNSWDLPISTSSGCRTSVDPSMCPKSWASTRTSRGCRPCYGWGWWPKARPRAPFTQMCRRAETLQKILWELRLVETGWCLWWWMLMMLMVRLHRNEESDVGYKTNHDFICWCFYGLSGSGGELSYIVWELATYFWAGMVHWMAFH